MARTTEAAVGKLIELSPSVDITPFIETANVLVTDCCGAAGYTADRLELIERWLTCHFYQIREQQVESEKAGSVSQKFRGKVDLLLNLTHYGQQAMVMDSKGGLAKLNKQLTDGAVAKIGVTYLGTAS